MTAEPFDVDWIDVRLAAGQPPASFFDQCRWCSHDWHGFRCSVCGCDSAVGARDDSWRPPLPVNRSYRVRELMDATGCDGYVACAALPLSPSFDLRIAKLQGWLRGTRP